MAMLMFPFHVSNMTPLWLALFHFNWLPNSPSHSIFSAVCWSISRRPLFLTNFTLNPNFNPTFNWLNG